MKPIAVVAVLVVATACGDRGGGPRRAARTVDIEMVDIAFKPKAVRVERGEKVRFVFHNRGQVVHDAFIGDAKAQADHEREMREESDHHMSGGKGDGITVEPGKTGEVVHAFDEAGTVEIGCHQPGHYAAGMKLAVAVA